MPGVVLTILPATSLSGPANGGTATAPMQGMSSMDHSNMGMSTMMAHCAQMRQQLSPSVAMSADIPEDPGPNMLPARPPVFMDGAVTALATVCCGPGERFHDCSV